MQTISLKVADNGVIKTVNDDNINAGGELFESTVVYDFETIENKIKFIEDICIDIGLSFGNTRNKNQISVNSGWGDNYVPSKKEALEKIKSLQNKITILQSIQ